MKVVITFNLDDGWDGYKNVNQELLVEDIFDNREGKDCLTIESYSVTA